MKFGKSFFEEIIRFRDTQHCTEVMIQLMQLPGAKEILDKNSVIYNKEYINKDTSMSNDSIEIIERLREAIKTSDWIHAFYEINTTLPNKLNELLSLILNKS